MTKYLLPLCIVVGLVLGFNLVRKFRNAPKASAFGVPEQAAQSELARPTPAPRFEPSPTPIPTPTPTPTPRQTVRVSLHNVTAVSVIENFAKATFQDLVILPSASDREVIIMGTLPTDIEAISEAVRAFDDSQRLITVHALVGRYTRTKGHSIGLFDYLATQSQNAPGDVSAILTGLAVDLTTGIATYGGSVTARMVLETISQFSSGEGQFRIESRPTITTISGKAAEFSTGREIPVSVTVNSQTTTQTSVEYKRADFRLTVTPTLRADGSVRLSLDQENAEVVGSIEINGNQVPTIATQKAKTVVDLEQDQLLYLGGIKSLVDEESDKGVPFIRKVFPLNLLAGKSTAKKESTELVIILAVEIQAAGKAGERTFEKFDADPDGFIASPKGKDFAGVDARKPETSTTQVSEK